MHQEQLLEPNNRQLPQWDTILDLLLTNPSEMIGDIRIEECLGCSDYAVVEFTLKRFVREKLKPGCSILEKLFKKLFKKIP